MIVRQKLATRVQQAFSKTIVHNHYTNTTIAATLRSYNSHAEMSSSSSTTKVINKRGLIWSKYDQGNSHENDENDKKIHLHHSKLSEIIRVDHAGEFGAVVITTGQQNVPSLRNDPTLEEILSQEREHFAKFDELITERRVRPTILRPIWYAAGTFAGVVTAALGRESAMACHKAVEEVISNHYTEQLRDIYDLSSSGQTEAERNFEFDQEMKSDEAEDAAKTQDYFFSTDYMKDHVQHKEAELRKYIRQFRDDELHHHELAEQNRAMESPFYNVLYNTIKSGCQIAIWLTKRF